MSLIGAATALSTVTSPPTCDDLNHCRSISSIVFSCASTIFLCTWVALHPNVPHNPREAWWKRLSKRTALTLLAVLAPEAILVWAVADWTESCTALKELLEKYPDCGWTETHAMFAWTGGFRLVKGNDNDRPPLYGKALFELVLTGEIDLPKTKKDEIQDRGKGDSIAKLIAVIQTLWFGIQAAHRVSNGLDVTELELTALAHVALNVFIYWSWWDKPLNVRFPIDIHPKKTEQGVSTSGELEDIGRVTEKDPESQVPGPIIPVRQTLPLRVRMGSISGIVDTVVSTTFGMIISVLFGAIHCLAWNSSFPTLIEHVLWRVSALIVTVVPVPCFIFGGLLTDVKGRVKGTLRAAILLLSLPYCCARICLLVVALMALRDLPYNAYQTASWTFYIPHIA